MVDHLARHADSTARTLAVCTGRRRGGARKNGRWLPQERQPLGQTVPKPPQGPTGPSWSPRTGLGPLASDRRGDNGPGDGETQNLTTSPRLSRRPPAASRKVTALGTVMETGS
jgi:hypothetical protein